MKSGGTMNNQEPSRREHEGDVAQRSLVESLKHAEGRYGGFCFGGQTPDGVTTTAPLPPGTTFPNGAAAALLLTFDVEGTYSNGTGDMALEVANYERICARLRESGIPATFNIVGQMAEEQGPAFVRWILDAGCEVAAHGYVHDLDRRYDSAKAYAGHYGSLVNTAQVRDAIAVFDRIQKGCVWGVRMPYAHFNEYTYDAIAAAGMSWSSNLGIDDWVEPTNGFGGAPCHIRLGDKEYDLVEIPLDTQTYDWPIWIADEQSNGVFVEAVRAYCRSRSIPFVRTPAGGVAVWRQRMLDAVASRTVFTLLCHPINLAVLSDSWGDPVEEFLFPVIDLLAGHAHRREAWVCTCSQMADFYRQTTTRGGSR
jgi:peptidoglycan/xylan/chitin deacetylase (PgdA/CDA1 family)